MKKIILLGILLSATFAQAQVGYGTPTPEAMLHVVKSTNVTNAVKIEGLTSATTESVSSLVIDENGIVKMKDVSTSLMPKFFYMPSVVLPTTQDQVTSLNGIYVPPATNPVTPNYFNFTPAVLNTDNSVNPPVITIISPAKCTVNLYGVFKNQFVSPKGQSSNATGLTDFVLDATKYEYYVTFLDENVFTFVSLSNDGILEYQIKSDAIIRNGSFMNIVLKVKN